MYIADLHIHSRYSRATSKDGTPEYLDLWARRKGIDIVGTGDFTHPAWREELKEKLVPAEQGLYVLKDEYRIGDPLGRAARQPRFVMSGEISSIYKKDGKVRKVHSVILLPGLLEAEILSKKLETIGNIHSDGRPILGLDCHDLLEITLELCKSAVYIPAHIWTPHFSLFGAFSGFDTVEECFGDLTPYIHAMETGLSSDPSMNWRLSALDSYQLISNSDAHSPSKLGREANLLDIDLSYEGLSKAIQTGTGLAGTIEFFPEEGKYHYDGHRKCHLCLSPVEAEKYEGKCPVCGKKLTIGVSHRVEQLADREEGFVLPGGKPFESLVPLTEVIAASTGHSSASVKVQRQYEAMLQTIGPEFSILREIPIEEIRSASGYLVSEGIRRLREGKVERRPGFDGEYGTIKLFGQMEIENLDGQMSLFTAEQMARLEADRKEQEKMELLPENGADPAAGKLSNGNAKLVDGKHQEKAVFPGEAGEPGGAAHPGEPGEPGEPGGAARPRETGQPGEAAHPDHARQPAVYNLLSGLNARQEEAVKEVLRAVAVIAGPGTGKTKTLVSRILYLLKERGVKASQITAVTFTKKAASEMRERLEKEAGGKRIVNRMQIGTFHSICLELLKKQGISFTLADDLQTFEYAQDAVREFGLKMTPKQFLFRYSLQKTGMEESISEEEKLPEEAAAYYGEQLERAGILDFDGLLVKTLELISTEQKNEIRGQSYSYLLVDEFQDINPIQYRLIKAWNRGGRELFVIGDPDQAIYSFRGSDDKCFDRLNEDFPGLHTIRLEQNYRSAPSIVSAALSVIGKNQGPERIVIPNRAGGLPLRIVTAESERSEGIFAAKEINRLVGGIDMLDAQERQREEREKTRSFADIALLYRTHKQAELLEACLQKEGIPYVVAGREGFLNEEKVRGTICFFRQLADPSDEVSKRVCRKLLWDLPENDITDTVLSAVSDKYRSKWKREKPGKLLTAWMEDLKLCGNPAMEKLTDMAVCYKNMEEFLDDLAFGTEGELKRCNGKNYTSDAVTLMTLHGSKGLEFPVVLLCGARKGVIPLEHGGTVENEPEERRLFYVGMTRAKEELILLTSKEPSPFLSDIPDAVVVREEAKRKWDRGGEQLSLFDLE